MKLKYYLRGIGIGIIFASIILLAVYRDNISTGLTDEEIRTRAKELGMVEADAPINNLINKTSMEITTENNSETKVDSDKKSTDKSEGKSTEKIEEKSTEKIEEKSTDKSEEKTTEKIEEKSTEKSEEKSTEKIEEKSTEKIEKKSTEKSTENVKTDEKKQDSKQTADNDDMNNIVEITIKKGSSSYPVCQKLQELGLIDDAAKFDDYLIEHGYANRISVGTHRLTKGMDYHSIAELISDPLD